MTTPKTKATKQFTLLTQLKKHFKIDENLKSESIDQYLEPPANRHVNVIINLTQTADRLNKLLRPM